MLPTNSKIARSYQKYPEVNPEQVHSNYAKWQKEKFGNVLENSDEETEDSMDDILDDFTNQE